MADHGDQERRAIRRGVGLAAAGMALVLVVGACTSDDADPADDPTDEASGPADTTTDEGSDGADDGSTGDPATFSYEPSPYAGSYTLSDPDTGTEVVVTVEGGTRTIDANGIPDHATGEFPNPGNPNAISAQDYAFTLPTDPVAGEASSYNVPQPFGIATNGVKIDPYAAEWYQDDPDSGWQLAALANPLGFDQNDAHVQPNGAYHYHGEITPLIRSTDHPTLLGWAGDGFPIYDEYGFEDPYDPSSPVVELVTSWQLKDGERPDGPGGTYDGTYVEDYEYVAGSGDLDECNGRDGVTAEYPDGTYYYVVTTTWPYIGRCFRGEIAESFVVGGPGDGPADVGGGAPGPP